MLKIFCDFCKKQADTNPDFMCEMNLFENMNGMNAQMQVISKSKRTNLHICFACFKDKIDFLLKE